MKQQTQQAISGISINSKHYVNQLESTIIQIARSVAIENKVVVDPDAKEITRQIIQKKINTLFSKEARATIVELNNAINKVIKETKPTEDLRSLVNCFKSIMKLMELDDVR